MGKEKTLIKKFDELKTRLALLATAGVIGLSGCAVQKKEQHEHDTKNVKEIIHQIDEKIIQENQLDQAQDIINDVNRLIPKLKLDGLNGMDRESLKNKKNDEVNFFDTIDISNYDGNSIEDALRTSGYGYSFAFREELANHFGIQNYRGTVEQNLELLNHLRGNHLQQEGTQEEQIEDVNGKNNATNGQSTTKETIVSVNQQEQGTQIDSPTSGGTNGSANQDDMLDETLKDKENLVRPGVNNSSGSSNDENHVNSRPEHGSGLRPGGGSSNRPGNGSGSNSGNQNTGNSENNENKPGIEKPPVIEHKHDIKKKISYNVKGNGVHEVVTKEYCTLGDYEKIVSNKDEKCTYVVISYNDQDELVNCSVCGDVTNRKHELNSGNKNEDGSVTYSCIHEGCNYAKTITNSVECDDEFVIYDYDDDKEYLKCSKDGCDKEITREHKKVAGDPLENGDIPYHCENEGCQWTFVKKAEIHTHEWVVDSYNDNEEILKCADPDCTETKTREHDLDEGVLQEDGSTLYSCQHEGCQWTFVKKAEVHIHEWVVDSHNENEENLKCADPSCTETKTRGHDLDEGVLQEDGSILYSCKHEGCNYTKLSHVHILEEDEEIVGTKDVCTRVVTYCTIDNEIIKIVDNPKHKYRTSSEGEILECRVCSYDPNLEDEEELVNDLDTDKVLSSGKLLDEEVLEESRSSEEITDGQEEETLTESEETLEATEFSKESESSSEEEEEETLTESEETLEVTGFPKESESSSEEEEEVLEESEEEIPEQPEEIIQETEEVFVNIPEEKENQVQRVVEQDEIIQNNVPQEKNLEQEEKGMARKLVLEKE